MLGCGRRSHSPEGQRAGSIAW